MLHPPLRFVPLVQPGDVSLPCSLAAAVALNGLLPLRRLPLQLLIDAITAAKRTC
jgi:hypothetical protein